MNQLQKDAYYQLIKKLGLARSVWGFKFYVKNLFGNIDFKGKTVLDIGAGAGAYSCYMALNGAKKVIGLEPESEGSRDNYISKFNKLKNGLRLNNVFLECLPFQKYAGGGLFDLILLHHSINHLDEEACVNLRKSFEARERYKAIFGGLHSMSSDGAEIIIVDCSNRNFFSFLEIRNPFAPDIEWHKHQSPEKWIDIMKKSGYRDFKIRWTALSQLGKIGDLILGNKFFSYFIHSQFTIYAKK